MENLAIDLLSIPSMHTDLSESLLSADSGFSFIYEDICYSKVYIYMPQAHT